VKCYIWSITFYGAKTWTLRKVDQKYLESFEMWYWRRIEKISWTDRVENEELLRKVGEECPACDKKKKGNSRHRSSMSKHQLLSSMSCSVVWASNVSLGTYMTYGITHHILLYMKPPVTVCPTDDICVLQSLPWVDATQHVNT
jgi:hypothetical protein